MRTYIYHFKQDASCEPIGRVMATSLYEARNIIMEIKRLPLDAVIDLFEIKVLHENNN
jgi:hypothetical protein